MNRLKESVLSGFHYTAPKDPEQRMMDFYFVSGFIFRDSVEKYPGKPEEQENMNFEVSNMFTDLQKHLILMLRFSLSCEFRHLFDGTVSNPKNVINAMSELEQEFCYRYSIYMTASSKDRLDNPYIPGTDEGLTRRVFRIEKKENEEIRRKSYSVVRRLQKELGISDSTLGSIFETTYNSKVAHWNSGYGGDKWKAIATGWLRLLNAHNTNDRMVMIDHVYDLQHNTNTVFNKLSQYLKNGSYGWVLRALDWKKENRSAEAFLQRISPQWRSIWKAFKGYSGETEEDVLTQSEKWKKDAIKVFKKHKFSVKQDIHSLLPMYVYISDKKEVKKLETILKYFGLSSMKELEKAFDVYGDSRYIFAELYLNDQGLIVVDADTKSRTNYYNASMAMGDLPNRHKNQIYNSYDDFQKEFISVNAPSTQQPIVNKASPYTSPKTPSSTSSPISNKEKIKYFFDNYIKTDKTFLFIPKTEEDIQYFYDLVAGTSYGFHGDKNELIGQLNKNREHDNLIFMSDLDPDYDSKKRKIFNFLNLQNK